VFELVVTLPYASCIGEMEFNMTQKLIDNILDVVKKDKLESNGWDIMYPKYFIDLGFDADFIKSLTERNESGEGKYQLYDNSGKAVKYLDGVHYLTLLQSCANIVSPDFYSKCEGRGFRANEYLKALKEALKKRTSTN
tara:strand:- start:277 stop:690 length:414 start_codon:yes stop_codon:yes gene_type:complete